MLRRSDFSKNIKPVLGSDDKFFVTLLGKIKDVNMDNVPVTIKDDGFGYVDIKFLGMDGEYRVIDIVVCHFKFLEDTLSFDELRSVEAFIIDENKIEKHNPNNLGYRFRGGKLPCKWNKDFFIVPGYPTRAVNINGDMISTIDGESRRWGINQPQERKNITGGYRCNNVYMRGIRYVLLRHRALMLVFRDYPNEVDKLVSNHINGIPGDDRLDNLEWVTRLGNNIHAFASGLRSQNKKVLARNTKTGEVLEYYSVAECGRCLGIKDRTLNFRLNKVAFGFTDSNGYQFKYKDDTRDWI